VDETNPPKTQEGESIMWISDLPPLPPFEAVPMVLAQAASTGETSSTIPMAGFCNIVGMYHDGDNEETSVDLFPKLGAGSYFLRYGEEKGISFHDAQVTLVQKPKNGVYKEDAYFPKQGFEGLDTVVFQVQKEGIKVQIKYFIVVHNLKLEPPVIAWQQCDVIMPGPGFDGVWKLSALPEGIDLANWYQTPLQALLTGAKDALTGFTDLPGASLGQTTASVGWVR
jgi:hypothetical protein